MVIVMNTISAFAAVLTVWSIVKSHQPGLGNTVRLATRGKNTLKIALLTVGNMVWNLLAIIRLSTDPESYKFFIIQTALCLFPGILSWYNPVVYVALTKNIIFKNSQVRVM